MDIACGTGQLCISILKDGIQSEGIDISKNMIEKAIENSINANTKINFTLQDMRNFSLNDRYDLITCIFDSINHLLNLQEWKETFLKVRKHLISGGFFIFDINSIKSLKEKWNAVNINKDDKGNYIIQKSVYIPDENISILNLSLFNKLNDKTFNLTEEQFIESSFDIELIKSILLESGFNEIYCMDNNFSASDNLEDLNRVIIACR